MKIFVFTWNRFDTISTSMLLENESIEHLVLCHNEESRKKFIDFGRVKESRIISTNNPKGLANNRNSALEMMDVGEWAIFLVDDFIQCFELDIYDFQLNNILPITSANTTHWNKRFQKKISFSKFLQRCEHDISIAEKNGIKLCGFACNGNPLFRKEKYKYWALVDGRAWSVKKTDLRFDTNAQMVDDSCWTAMNLQRFGKVLVNQWILPNCRRYSSGSYGSIHERMKQKKIECEYLVKKFPGLVTIAKKKGWDDGCHVKIVSIPKL